MRLRFLAAIFAVLLLSCAAHADMVVTGGGSAAYAGPFTFSFVVPDSLSTSTLDVVTSFTYNGNTVLNPSRVVFFGGGFYLYLNDMLTSSDGQRLYLAMMVQGDQLYSDSGTALVFIPNSTMHITNAMSMFELEGYMWAPSFYGISHVETRAVPEPSTLILLLLGTVGCGSFEYLHRLRRRRTTTTIL